MGSSSGSTELTVVLPVYNEAGCIEAVLDSITRVLGRVPGETRVLVVDDGSKDETPGILDRIARDNSKVRVLHQLNAGHGAAVVNGCKRAVEEGAEWIFQTDSDDQIPAEEFLKLWERRNDSPFILGRRADRHDPLHRIVISKINRLIIFLLFGVYLKDPNIPFRLMRADFLKTLLPHVGGVFAPNIFLSILAKRKGARTLDIPVTHKLRETGTPSINFRRLWRICFRCVSELFSLFRSL